MNIIEKMVTWIGFFHPFFFVHKFFSDLFMKGRRQETEIVSSHFSHSLMLSLPSLLWTLFSALTVYSEFSISTYM